MKTFGLKKTFLLAAMFCVAAVWTFAVPSTLDFQQNDQEQVNRVLEADNLIRKGEYNSALKALGQTDSPLILLYKGRFFRDVSIPQEEKNQIQIQQDFQEMLQQFGKDNPLLQLFLFEDQYHLIYATAGLFEEVDASVNFSKAKEYFDFAYKNKCYDSIDLYYMANLHNIVSKDYQASNKLLEEYIALEPADPDAWYGISLNLFAMEKFQEAIPYAQKAIKLDKKNYNGLLDIYYYHILDLFMYTQDFKNFKKYAVEANKKCPSIPFSFYAGYSEILLNQNQKKAVASYVKTIKQYPQNYIEILDNQISTLDTQNSYQLITKTKSFATEPWQQFMIHYYLAQCAVYLDKFDEGMEEVKIARELVPSIMDNYPDLTQEQFFQTLDSIQEALISKKYAAPDNQ